MGLRSRLKRIYARLGGSRRSNAERKIVTRIGKKKYEIVSDDDYLNHVGRKFEPDTIRLLDSLTQDGQYVFDVGANIGCTAIFLAAKAKQLFCFEPSPTTFKFLERNINNAALKNVTCVNVGLGQSAQRSELTFAPSNRSGGFVSNHMQASAGHVSEKITIVRGDEFISSTQIPRVDFMKIDVEGSEMNVIEGMRLSIKRSRPVVALELNHWCLNAFQRKSVPAFFDFLRGVFPLLYAIDKNDVRDLRNPNDAYHVMYAHIILGFKYPTIVGAFSREQLFDFSNAYQVPP